MPQYLSILPRNQQITSAHNQIITEITYYVECQALKNILLPFYIQSTKLIPQPAIRGHGPHDSYPVRTLDCQSQELLKTDNNYE